MRTSAIAFIVVLVALFVAFFAGRVSAQSRLDNYPEANMQWTEYRVTALEDGGVSIAGTCQITTDDGGQRQVVVAPNANVSGAGNRTQAINLGDGPATRTCKREFRVGNGAPP